MEQRSQLSTGIRAAELQERRNRLLEHVRRDGLSGYVLFGADYIQYFTGFWFLSNERPVIYAESVGGESAVFVPEFEVERTRAESAFARIESYPEYPGIKHPMLIFARVLADLGIKDAIGADQGGYSGILGYKGPALSDATGASVARLADVIEGMMARKSESEIAFIRESGRWCAHAHRLLQEYSRPGATEAEAASAPARRRRSRCWRRSAMHTAAGSRPRPARPPATGVRSGSVAHGRTPSRTTSSSAQATSW